MVDSVVQLEKYMDVLAARQRLVTSNIANADTPGYHTQDIDFQSAFEGALTSESKPTAEEVPGLRTKNDGNNVSLDRETRLLSENAIRFSAASNLIRSNFRILKSAIHDGQQQ